MIESCYSLSIISSVRSSLHNHAPYVGRSLTGAMADVCLDFTS